MNLHEIFTSLAIFGILVLVAIAIKETMSYLKHHDTTGHNYFRPTIKRNKP